MAAPKGNKNNEKWKTPEERIKACDAFCKYVENGGHPEYYPEADYDTINRYIEKYPIEFTPEKITKAFNKGFEYWMEQGKQGMWGGKQFNPSVWIFIMKNKYGWTDRKDVTTKGDKVDTLHGLLIEAEEDNSEQD